MNNNNQPYKSSQNLWILLQRRRISFSRWCEEQDIKTQEDFKTRKETIETQGEFYLPEEMTTLCNSTLPQLQVGLVEDKEPLPLSTVNDEKNEPVSQEEKEVLNVVVPEVVNEVPLEVADETASETVNEVTSIATNEVTRKKKSSSKLD